MSVPCPPAVSRTVGTTSLAGIQLASKATSSTVLSPRLPRRPSATYPAAAGRASDLSTSSEYLTEGVKVALTMGSAGRVSTAPGTLADRLILPAIFRLSDWLDRNDYKGYDTFDGLSAKVRPLAFNNVFLLTALQQGVRRFPINLRPLLGIPKSRSTKGMGFLARGFMRMHSATNDSVWGDKARLALNWLIEHRSPGYSGACWGNHFDYQSRTFYLPKGVPTVVWTSLIGHAFLDGFEHFQDESYLEIAASACDHILQDLASYPDGNGVCISYIPTQNTQVHNANTLGGSLLARTYRHTGTERYLDRARSALQYTAQYLRPDGSWYYGEKSNLHWVDNFHTAYVLDSFKHYQDATGDRRFEEVTRRGYDYWKRTFFLEDGTPRYYSGRTLPLDIQCSSQAIDTLVYFRGLDPDGLSLALKVAAWTIANMQDSTGYFYYRRYSKWVVNKTPTLHWGQATMLSALAGLYQAL
jgi:polysaccharide biosynthesis protein VpsJ